MNAVDYFSNKYLGITPKNSNLTKAKAAKNDEFYTQYSDIEAELSHYDVKYFADRVVYLPCDDWHFSQFVKYFENNFTRLQLKALVATGINFSGYGYYYKKTLEGVVTGVLESNGDFRSDACRQLMREADIIVTNPPFSLFREFVAQIMEFRKKFLIIGNQSAITYKDFFPYLRDNRIWTGAGFTSGNAYFKPAGDVCENDFAKGVFNPKTGLCKFRNCLWFTNMDLKKRHEPLMLNGIYDAAKYPKYDNYDAIEVAKLNIIPSDYFGVMGVPITFLNKYCPDQFEILGCPNADVLPDDYGSGMSQQFVDDYYESGGTASIRAGNRNLVYYDFNGKPTIPYARILIKRKTIPVEAE